MWIRSPMLLEAGFEHGFSTREGGVSEGAFRSLNLARTVGDDPDAVAENSRRFAAGLPCALERLYEVSQVHGCAVVEVGEGDDVRTVRQCEADALITRAEGVSVAVRTADCVPILLADPVSGAVAAVHAGWRGIVAEVLTEALGRLGAPAGGVLAAIGPHIRAFEVSEDVAGQIAAVSHGVDVVRPREPRPHVDLSLAVRAQLQHAGLTRVEDVGGCTFAEPDRFFSYRRDAGATGRLLSAIVARAPSVR